MTSQNFSAGSTADTSVIYSEKQWVPWHWWLLGAFVVALITAQLAMNRSALWLYAPAVLLTAVAVWVLLSLSKTRIAVEVDPDGTRWLVAGDANLPDSVVSRSMMVPATAKRNAMGRQLDPSAFVVSHEWVPEMVMLVINDDDDPTPYWLVSSKDPETLLHAFLPHQHPSR
ncbi:hypothetical protein FRC0129_01416 [Corynebacterium diphtheriae]|nr:hypothetical protein CIP107549_01396 [Corynebacterium diphtheriae]CAB0753109.1 hypothetical protein FRC0129_01416 [Corynebacterium diphtheriae]